MRPANFLCAPQHRAVRVELCMSQWQLSARAYHRILKLLRTIADLAEALQIG